MRYDRDSRPWAAPAPGLRLLPWESPEGKPCFLSTDGNGGPVSRLADDLEETQLSLGTEALAEAESALDDPAAEPLTLRVALRKTSWALRDALRIADSRGDRIAESDSWDSRDSQDG